MTVAHGPDGAGAFPESSSSPAIRAIRLRDLAAGPTRPAIDAVAGSEKASATWLRRRGSGRGSWPRRRRRGCRPCRGASSGKQETPSEADSSGTASQGRQAAAIAERTTSATVSASAAPVLGRTTTTRSSSSRATTSLPRSVRAIASATRRTAAVGGLGAVRQAERAEAVDLDAEDRQGLAVPLGLREGVRQDRVQERGVADRGRAPRRGLRAAPAGRRGARARRRRPWRRGSSGGGPPVAASRPRGRAGRRPARSSGSGRRTRGPGRAGTPAPRPARASSPRTPRARRRPASGRGRPASSRSRISSTRQASASSPARATSADSICSGSRADATRSANSWTRRPPRDGPSASAASRNRPASPPSQSSNRDRSPGSDRVIDEGDPSWPSPARGGRRGCPRRARRGWRRHRGVEALRRGVLRLDSGHGDLEGWEIGGFGRTCSSL